MKTLIILFFVCLVFSSFGWKKFVWFLSLGYGYSVAACAVAMLIMHWGNATWATGLMCLTLAVYGCRLGTYCLSRELKSLSYQKQLPDLTKTSRPMTFGPKLSIWLSVSLLYVMEVSPVAFRMDGGIENLWQWIGLIIMISGVALESASDAQKSAAKKKNPNRFVDTGLFRIVRCPNYLGEVTVWTGCFLGGIGAYQMWWQWVIAGLGYVSIAYIMFGGARRLELRQNRNYGNDPEYQAYVKKTPILLPLVPLYSVAKYEWLKG